MQTTTEQPSSPKPETPPSGRLRPERNIVIVELAFCAAFAAAAAILLRRPDGTFDPAALHEWFSARSAWSRVILSTAMLVCLAVEFDLLGRFLAGPLARMVHGRKATRLQTAGCRIAIQAFLLALIGIGPLVAPNVFPAPHGWGWVAILGALALPLGLSVVESRRNRHA